MLAALLLGGCAQLRPSAPAPLDVDAVTREAEARYAAGDWAAAADAYQRLVDADPRSADRWFRLANARARSGSPDRAVAAYREVLARDAGYAKAGFNLGLVQLRDAAETFRHLENQDSLDAALRAQATRLREAIDQALAAQNAPAAETR